MQAHQLHRIRSISEFHQLRDLPKPAHPLISVVNVSDMQHLDEPVHLILDYYSISLKRGLTGKFKYGQQEYDFDEGVMYFIAPNQIFAIEHNKEEVLRQTGWLLLIHPDFLWNTPLAKKIRQYQYFNYSVNEALFLSGKEEAIITNIVQNIQQEYH